MSVEAEARPQKSFEEGTSPKAKATHYSAAKRYTYTGKVGEELEQSSRRHSSAARWKDISNGAGDLSDWTGNATALSRFVGGSKG